MRTKAELHRLIGLLLSLILCLSLFPISAFAEEPASYLTFTAGKANSSVTFNYVSNYNVEVEYSIDGEEWLNCPSGTTIALVAVRDFVMFRGSNVQTSADKHFTMTGSIAASGDVTSLTNGSGGDVTLKKLCYAYMFYGCTALTAAPELPSTGLNQKCYQHMFHGCTALTIAPELPATTLADYCYQFMFDGCTALTIAPELPAETMAASCYSYMFYGCSKLENAPALPATTLAAGCYQAMFYGCTGLKSAPALPATTLADYCYYSMFQGCTSLTAAPELPATTMCTTCYSSMFQDCTALEAAPALPATTLAPSCYSFMFNKCTNLKLYKSGSGATWGIPAEAVAASNWNQEMFTGTGGTIDVLPVIGAMYYTDSSNYLSFKALEAGSTVTLNFASGSSVSYSLNGLGWTSCSDGTTVALGVGDQVRFRGYGVTTDADHHFTMTGTISASGEVTSLTNGVGGDASLSAYCYSHMFDGCTALTTAPELPSKLLQIGCYSYMFNGCSNLMLYADGRGEIWGIPAGAVAATDWNTDMFAGTGGTIDAAPVIGVSYFTLPAGLTVSGSVSSYNPNNETTLQLMQNGVEKYTTAIAAATGNGSATQPFSFSGVAAGTYDLVVTKASHLTYTLTGVVVGDSAPDVGVLTLLCGDIDGNGYINFSDYQILLNSANYDRQTSEVGVNATADLDGNSWINFSDYQILLNSQNYDKSAVYDCTFVFSAF